MHKRILELHRLLPFVLLTTLVLPTIASAAGNAVPAGKEQPPASERPQDIPRSNATPMFGYVYMVEAGDDIWLIAVSHGLSMEALASTNNLEPPYLLHPGDKLWVPAEPAPIKRTPDPTPTPPPPPPAPIETATTAAADAQPLASPSEAPPAPETTPEVEAAAAAAGAVTTGFAARAPVTSDDAALILNLMNEKRTAYGLPALSWSAELTAAAQAHAEDCAWRGWGSHTGSDGARLRTRLARADYYPSWASENWANARGAQHAFDMWWYEGPGGVHYENIMGRNYSQAGVGIAKGGWGYYYVVDFGAP